MPNAGMSTDPDLDAAYALRTPEDSRRLYGDWAATYDEGFATAMEYRLPEAVAATFAEAGRAGPVLDLGAGTGLLGAALAARGIGPVDGLDISAEMLARAAAKGCYRQLSLADLTRRLELADVAYAGIVSSGTFTHGHVGPAALDEALRVARPGALFALSVKADIWHSAGFEAKFAALGAAIAGLELPEVAIYGAGTDAAHAGDRAFVARFRKA